MKTPLARGHIIDLIVSEATSEVATRPVNAIAEPLCACDIERR